MSSIFDDEIINKRVLEYFANEIKKEQVARTIEKIDTCKKIYTNIDLNLLKPVL